MKLIASSILLVALAAASSAQVLNGSFQDGVGTTADNWTLTGLNSLALTDADYIAGAGATGSSPYGGRFLSFNAADVAPPNTATQIFSTVAGQSYVLSFAFGNFANSAGTQVLNVAVTDGMTGLATTSISDSSGTSDLSTVFDMYSLSFTALSNLTTLTFNDLGSDTNSTDGLVDNISVTQAVPEPASMIALGVGGLALLRRRRAAR